MKRLSFFVAVTLACTLLAGPGQQALLTVKTPAGAGGAWYYVTSEASLNASDSGLNASTMVWGDITLPTGNATKISVYVNTVNVPGGIVRLGLFSNAGTKLQDALTAGISATGWKDVTITTQAVTSGTYKVSYIGQGNDEVDVAYNNSTGTSSYNSSQSAGNLPSSLPSPDGTFTGLIGVRVWVQ